MQWSHVSFLTGEIPLLALNFRDVVSLRNELPKQSNLDMEKRTGGV